MADRRSQIDAFFDRQEEQERAQNLPAIDPLADLRDPDEAANELRIAQEVGEPPQAVRAYPDLFTRNAEARRIERSTETAPRLRNWLNQPGNLDVARDDVDNLSIFERVGRTVAAFNPVTALGADAFGALRTGDPLGNEQGRQGELDVEYSRLAFRDRMEVDGGQPLTPEERARLDELATREGQDNWGGFVIGPVRRIFPQLVESGRRAIETGARATDEVWDDPFTLREGERWDARRVLEGGVAATFEAPAAAVAGFGGAVEGYLRSGYEMETGLFFDQAVRQGVDRQIAAERADEYGRWATAIEFVSDALLAPISGAGKLAARALIGERVLTRSRPVLSAARSVAGTGVEQGLEEAAQEYAQIIHQDLAEQDQAAGGDSSSSRVRWSEVLTPEHIEQMLMAGYIGAQGGVGMGAVPATLNFAIDMRAVSRADRSAQVFEQWTRAAQASRLNERGLASTMESAIGAMDESNVYVDADRFVEHFQGAGVSPYAVAEELGIGEQTLAAALASHGQVEIPTARFAARLLRVPAHAGLAQHARIAPDADTPAEAQAAAARIQAEVERIAEEAAVVQSDNDIGAVVETRMRELLTRAAEEGGPRSEVNARYARLIAALPRAMVARARATNPAYAEKLDARLRALFGSNLDVAGPARPGRGAENAEMGQRGVGPDAGPVRNETYTPPEGVRMSERMRKIVEMAVNGASNDWIAEEMGVASNNVRVTLNQAKAKLGGATPWESAGAGGGAPGVVARTGELTSTTDELVRLRDQLRAAGMSDRDLITAIAERRGLKRDNVFKRLWNYDQTRKAAEREAVRSPQPETAADLRRRWVDTQTVRNVIPGGEPGDYHYGFALSSGRQMYVGIADDGNGAATIDWSFLDRLKNTDENDPTALYGDGTEKISASEWRELRIAIRAIFEADMARHERPAYMFTPQRESNRRSNMNMLAEMGDGLGYDLREEQGSVYLFRPDAGIAANGRIKPHPGWDPKFEEPQEYGSQEEADDAQNAFYASVAEAEVSADGPTLSDVAQATRSERREAEKRLAGAEGVAGGNEPGSRELNQGDAVALAQGDELGQPLGGITPTAFDADGRMTAAIIRLYAYDNGRAYNLSTFLHETGHLFLEIFRGIAADTDAPQEFQQMWNDTLSWFGVTQEQWSALTYEQRVPFHEKWAETFERYLMDGQAPSLSLREAFAVFKQWLLNVYRSIASFAAQNPNASLSPEIRQVFDRLIATDNEIAEARAAMGADFALARDAFKTDEEFAQYQQAIAEAKDAQEADLRARAMDAYARKSKRWWRGERERMRAAATRAVDSEPARRVEQWLAFQEWRALPDTTLSDEGEIGYVAPEGALEAMPEGLPAMQLSAEALQQEWPDAQLPTSVRPRTDVEAVLAEAMALKAQEKGRGQFRAQRLASFIKKNGGIQDPDGRIKAALGSGRRRPGLINNESGKTPEEMLRLATAAGYFGEAAAREMRQNPPDAGGLPARNGVREVSGMDRLLHSPSARHLYAEDNAVIHQMQMGDQPVTMYDFKDSPALTNVRFHPMPDGQTFAIAMSARGVSANSSMATKAQTFADAISAIEHHAMRNQAKRRAYRYLFTGETDAHTRLFRALAERAEWPRGAVIHDTPAGFEISFDPQRAPFSGTLPNNGYAHQPETRPNLGQDGATLRLSEIINNRSRQIAQGQQPAAALPDGGQGPLSFKGLDTAWNETNGYVDLYHASPEEIVGNFRPNSFFSTYPDYNAEMFGNADMPVTRARARIQRPYDVPEAEEAAFMRADPALIERVRSQGYDALRMSDASGGYEVIPLGPVERAPERPNAGDGFEMFQGGTGPIFESAVVRTVEASTTQRAPGAQWLATISKAQGVKKEEIEWMGLADWLKAQEGPVSRDDLLQFVRENGVRVEETVLGGEANLSPEQQARLLPMIEERDRLRAERATPTSRERQAEIDVRLDQLSDQILELDPSRNSLSGRNNTRWSQYTLPGGENYRELLLRLPSDPKNIDELAAAEALRSENLRWDALNERERENFRNTVRFRNRDAGFKSSHFDQPNILAHVRFNERTDAQGRRTLFIEEVQSDWHQAGRERGYQGGNDEAIIAQLRAEIPESAWGRDDFYDTPEDLLSDARQQQGPLKDAIEALEALEAQGLNAASVDTILRNARNAGAVPDAPFKNNAWASLSMKRMIRWAAENGFDQIAWTRGQHQIERFNLEKFVDDLEWRFEPRIEGEQGGSTRGTLTGRKDGANIINQVMDESELPGMIGKELAERLLAAPHGRIAQGRASRTLSGVDLRVGGEGMRAFYDRILPNIANDLGKKFGARVGETEIKTLDEALFRQTGENKFKNETVHSLPITPEMREKVVTRGFEMFQGGAYGANDRGAVARLIARLKREVEFAQTPSPDFVNSSLYPERLFDRTNEVGVSRAYGRKGDAANWNIDPEIMTAFNELSEMEQAEVIQELEDAMAEFDAEGPGADLGDAWEQVKARNNNFDMTDDEIIADIEESAAADMTPDQRKYQAGLRRQQFRALEGYKQAFEMFAGANNKTPTVEEFLSTLIADLTGERQVYSARDTNALASAQALSDAQEWFDAHDIDLSKDKETIRAQIVSALEADRAGENQWHPDDAAPWFGFSSGDELIQALSALKPRNVAIEEQIDAMLEQEHGDAGSRDKIAESARLAAHAEVQARRIEIELAAIQKATGGRATPVGRAAKAYAERQLQAMTVKQIRNYETFLAGERRAARAAMEATQKKDYATAAQMKQRQLVSFHLYRFARDASEEMDRAQRYFQKFDRDTVRAKIHPPLMDQIDQALEGIDLRAKPRIAERRRQNFNAWLAEMQAEGLEHLVVADPDFIEAARNRPFTTLTLEEARSIRDAVRNFEHIGRRWREVLGARDARLLDEAVSQMSASMAMVKPLSFVNPADHSPGLIERLDTGRQSFHAQLSRVEFVARAMDGMKENGPVWNGLFRPLTEARDREETRQQQAQRDIEQLFSVYNAKERADMWTKRKFYPQVPNRNGTAMGRNFTKQEILAIALNTGNDYNFGALIAGDNWNEQQVRALLDTAMDARDWEFVQSLWDYVDSFWPEIEALYLKSAGVAPPKVKPTPFTNRHGEWRGGYWHLEYDYGRDQRVREEAEHGAVQEAFGGFRLRTQTPNGFSKARQGSGGRPVRLELSILTEHVNEVIHDLEFRMPVLNTWRLIKHGGFREAFVRAAGQEQYDQLKPWLQYVATERMPPERGFASVIKLLRRNTPIALIGYSISTITQQPAGLMGTFARVGTGRVMSKAAELLAPWNWPKWPAHARFINTRSTLMRNRTMISQREIREMVQEINSQGHVDAVNLMLTGSLSQKKAAFDRVAQLMQRYALFPLAFVDKWVSSAAWKAAYDKALAGHVEGVSPQNEADVIAYADHIIRTTFGSGRPEDLSPVMRSSEIGKLLTPTFSYFNTQYNQIYNEQAPGMMRGQLSPLEFATFITFTIVAQALVSQWLAGRWAPDEDESDEDRNTRLAMEVALAPVAGIPLLRDMARAALQTATTGATFGSNVPAFGAVSSTGMGVGGAIYDLKEEGEISRKSMRDLTMAAGYWFGLPSNALWRAGEAATDVATGEDDLSDPADTAAEAFLRDRR